MLMFGFQVSLALSFLFISTSVHSADLRGKKYQLKDGTSCEYQTPEMPRSVEFRWRLSETVVRASVAGDAQVPAEFTAYACVYQAQCDREPFNRFTYTRSKKKLECPALNAALEPTNYKDEAATNGKGEWDKTPGSPGNYGGRVRFVRSLNQWCSITYSGYPLLLGLAPRLGSDKDMQETCFVIARCGNDEKTFHFGTATPENGLCPDLERYTFYSPSDPDYKRFNPRPRNPNFPAIESTDAVIDRDSYPAHADLVNAHKVDIKPRPNAEKTNR